MKELTLDDCITRLLNFSETASDSKITWCWSNFKYETKEAPGELRTSPVFEKQIDAAGNVRLLTDSNIKKLTEWYIYMTDNNYVITDFSINHKSVESELINNSKDYDVIFHVNPNPKKESKIRYLVTADVSTEMFTTSEYLFGIFESEEDALNFIKTWKPKKKSKNFMNDPYTFDFYKGTYLKKKDVTDKDLIDTYIQKFDPEEGPMLIAAHFE